MRSSTGSGKAAGPALKLNARVTGRAGAEVLTLGNLSLKFAVRRKQKSREKYRCIGYQKSAPAVVKGRAPTLSTDKIRVSALRTPQQLENS